MDDRTVSGSDISKTNMEAVTGMPKKRPADDEVATEDFFAERTNRFLVYLTYTF